MIRAATSEGQELRTFHGMLSRAPSMHDLWNTLERAAATDAPILIRGETGSGKELVARALHDLSPRASRPFLAVNCATLTGDLLASELFGHVRGAFTGAVRARQGLFERADGGTVFLDEIGELPLDIQPRLLRVLQESSFTPVGGSEARKVDVRMVSATHRSLRRGVQEGRFRADLMFRIRVATVFLPPLRERRDDIAPLLRHFIATLDTGGRRMEGIEPDALACMVAYDWPGNVRELRNVVQAAMALGTGPRLTLADLPPELRGEGPPEPHEPAVQAVRREDRAEILEALVQARGNRSRAAARLGISRTTLWRRMKVLGLDAL
ncbi:MAG: sigma 54-interacting transcriptional regulator [Myxococcales bacterium]|nr:sigma 54-interacting transcriptional regulator [Myxococcales bacterium]MCB9671609.1 sigma 54-interacting transcriptional regulator [Alphaproteobacteria bacterium]MCB9693108.1 sigma 54-interacting transcriptional regulator [Alphaproteobacteria bacterium]